MENDRNTILKKYSAMEVDWQVEKQKAEELWRKGRQDACSEAESIYAELIADRGRPSLCKIVNDCSDLFGGDFGGRVLFETSLLLADVGGDTRQQAQKLCQGGVFEFIKGLFSFVKRSGAGIRAFISYRRSNGSTMAQAVSKGLTLKAIDTFLDVSDMSGGPFPRQLEERIRSSTGFVAVLTPGYLDPGGTDHGA